MLVVALDGPAGAGKSTVSRRLAARLGVPYLDTGAMYRCVALAALAAGIDPSDAGAVGELSRRIQLDISADAVTLDGNDVTQAIRGPAVNATVSTIAANSEVRAEMRARQRTWAESAGGGVVEGRDIGSVVFPDATLKVFLTASPMERAHRRAAEAGGEVDEIAASIAARDHMDSTRVDSPLVAAVGSIVVDTDGLDVSEVIDRIVELLAAPPNGQRGSADTPKGSPT